MILYEGPSLLDGKPIVAIATIDSRNEKTGDMVQIWILRRDTAPHIAARNGQDRSVCGDCPQRHFKGGGCYVVTHQAPLSVWRRLHEGDGYESPGWNRRVQRAMMTTPIRLGAYGDPAAVPFHVWEELIAQGCKRWTGYTHQWRTCAPEYREILMASCDSEAEARAARAAGWRFFLVTQAGQCDADLGTVECLSDSRNITCEECGICDGTRADSRSDSAASVHITVHGQRAHRFLPVVHA